MTHSKGCQIGDMVVRGIISPARLLTAEGHNEELEEGYALDTMCFARAKHSIKMKCNTHSASIHDSDVFRLCDKHIRSFVTEGQGRTSKIQSFGPKQVLVEPNDTTTATTDDVCSYRMIIRKNRL